MLIFPLEWELRPSVRTCTPEIKLIAIRARETMLRSLVRPAKFFRDLITRRKPIAIMIIVPYRIVSPRIHADQGFSIPMICPNEKNQKRNKETSTPALSPFLIRNLKEKK